MQSSDSPRLRVPRPPSVPVFILCGGEGSRLRAIEARPKAVIPVAGVPFLGYTLRLLHLQGFRRVHLLLGKGADDVRRTYAGPGLDYVREETRLGTGGALGLARDRAARVNLILNGDSYAEVLFTDLLRAHAARGSSAWRGLTLLALEVEDSSDYGSLAIADDGQVTAFLEKSAAGPGMVNAGAYVAGGGFFRGLPAGACSLEREILPRLAADGLLWAVRQRFFFRDIGTPARLAAALEEFPRIRGRIPEGQRVPWIATLAGSEGGAA